MLADTAIARKLRPYWEPKPTGRALGSSWLRFLIHISHSSDHPAEGALDHIAISPGVICERLPFSFISAVAWTRTSSSCSGLVSSDRSDLCSREPISGGFDEGTTCVSRLDWSRCICSWGLVWDTERPVPCAFAPSVLNDVNQRGMPSNEASSRRSWLCLPAI